MATRSTYQHLLDVVAAAGGPDRMVDVALAKAFDGLPPHGGLRGDLYHPVDAHRRSPVEVARYTESPDTALGLAERDAEVVDVTSDVGDGLITVHVAFKWGTPGHRLRQSGEGRPTRWQAILDAYLRLRILRFDVDDPDDVVPHPDAPAGRRLAKVVEVLSRPAFGKGPGSVDAIEAVASWVSESRSGLLEGLANEIDATSLAPCDALALSHVLRPVAKGMPGIAAFHAGLETSLRSRRIAASLRPGIPHPRDGATAA